MEKPQLDWKKQSSHANNLFAYSSETVKDMKKKGKHNHFAYGDLFLCLKIL